MSGSINFTERTSRESEELETIIGINPTMPTTELGYDVPETL